MTKRSRRHVVDNSVNAATIISTVKYDCNKLAESFSSYPGEWRCKNERKAKTCDRITEMT